MTVIGKSDWFDGDVTAGLRRGLLLGAAALVLAIPPARPGAQLQDTGQATLAPAIERRLDLGQVAVSADALRLASWVVAAADNGDRHFAVIDKKDARLLVFEPGGRLVGATPVLLGHAPGDDTVEGVGKRPIEQIRPEERTTPAGRFVARSGRNALAEDVVWVDYDAAVSMHRVRLTDASERRLERLASPTAADNRISWGCINVPTVFFDTVVWPALGPRHGIVYVLPEHKTLEQVFPGVAGAGSAFRS